METDRYGLPLSTASREAAAAYRQGVDLILCAYPGAEENLRKAVHHDEGFALAAAASARERAHVHILSLLIDGPPGKSLEALLQHLEEFPRDALSLALGAFGLYGFSGRADHDAARLALCRKLAPRYGEDWWFLTHLGWSHTEAGRLGAGARITERALNLRRENAHCAHALLHFFAEADEGEDGIEFIDGWLPGYDPRAMLYSHLAWHRALWSLEQGDVDRALETYAQMLRPTQTAAPPIIALSDSASLLWRLLVFDPRINPRLGAKCMAMQRSVFLCRRRTSSNGISPWRPRAPASSPRSIAASPPCRSCRRARCCSAPAPLFALLRSLNTKKWCAC